MLHLFKKWRGEFNGEGLMTDLAVLHLMSASMAQQRRKPNNSCCPQLASVCILQESIDSHEELVEHLSALLDGAMLSGRLSECDRDDTADFLARLLDIDPEMRMSMEMAMHHWFLQEST